VTYVYCFALCGYAADDMASEMLMIDSDPHELSYLRPLESESVKITGAGDGENGLLSGRVDAVQLDRVELRGRCFLQVFEMNRATGQATS
jgi:hypothetical protein